MDSTLELPESFTTNGYTILPNVLDKTTIDHLIDALASLPNAGVDTRGGTRHILRDSPTIQALARNPIVRGIAEAALGPGAFSVRGLFFDKTPDANWKVIWHQDLTIAVKEQHEVLGFGPWSEKDCVPHVQPPAALLANMIAVRIHLDDCTESNGPVRVLPGSHLAGRLSATEIDRWRAETPEIICTVPRGGCLVFHSLLLHASSPAQVPQHRRVIHLEYIAGQWAELPGGLTWYEQYR